MKKFHTFLCFLFSLGILAGAAPEKNVAILLVTPDKLADAWKPFADWKTKQGKPTTIIRLSQIDSDYKGADIQAKIRACALAHIDNHGARWIILGADSQPSDKKGVPDRNTAHPAMGPEYSDLPTDAYFISPTDWDADDDGNYGEWPDDKDAISYSHPKAVVGRIPLRIAEDVAAYTEKVIAFERGKRSGADEMVLTCTVPQAYNKVLKGGGVVGQAWPAGTMHGFFSHATSWDEDSQGDFALSPENWKSKINSGEIEKWHIHGHGLTQNWILEGNTKVGLAEVEALTNKESSLLITTVSCFTGQFDSKKDPSISEAMLRKADGGALLVFAPSREGMPIFMNPQEDIPQMVRQGKMDGTTRTMMMFWKYALEEPRTAGEAAALSKSAFVMRARMNPRFHFLLCELNLLGDPSLVIATKDEN